MLAANTSPAQIVGNELQDLSPMALSLISSFILPDIKILSGFMGASLRGR